MAEENKKSARPSICFVALGSYAALVDDLEVGGIGGAEVQQTIIGRSLAKQGYRVTFVTLDHGQDDGMEIDGIRIIKAYDENVGIPMLRFLYPRVTSLWRAMKRANTDIYYQRIGDSTTGIVAAFCHWYQREFAFAVAHNYDCLADPPPGRLARHARVLYHYGLRNANLVLAQTTAQQTLLRENFGIDSTVIPNCAPDYGHRLSGADVVPFAQRRRFLWTGAFRPVKRLELLLDVAEHERDLHFDVVGDAKTDSEYVRQLRMRAKSMPNVRLHGRVPHAHMKAFYEKAAALICTSRSEGFPNIFLEAWSCGLPVVSTFDPDDIIAKHGLGMVAEDVPGLIAGIQRMSDSEQRWCKASRDSLKYYRGNHSVEAVLPRIEHALMSLAHGTESQSLLARTTAMQS